MLPLKPERLLYPQTAAPSYGLRAVWKEIEPSAEKGSNWAIFIHHIRAAAHHFRLARRSSILTVTVCTLVLCLCTLGVLTVLNAERMLREARGGVGLSVYLLDGVSPANRQVIEDTLHRDSRVESIHYESKDDALQSMRNELPAAELLLQGIDERNPLPASYQITLRQEFTNPTDFQEIRRVLQPLSGIEFVQYNNGLLNQLSSFLEVCRLSGVGAVVSMLLVACFIVAVTVVLSVGRFKDEIQIMRLVGATERFIRTPFIVEGVVTGILGGLGGGVTAFFVYSLFRSYLSVDPILEPMIQWLQFLPLWLSIVVVLASGATGGVASWISVRNSMPRSDA
jgi:cell division transport system permease protein